MKIQQTQYKPYPEYKDANAGWLDIVPKHWKTKRTKFLFKIKKRIAGKLGHNVLAITQQGVKVKNIVDGGGQLSMDYSKYQIVEVGDFAMNHMDLLTGYVDISLFNGVTSPDYRVFSMTDTESITHYFLYLYQMGYTNKIFYAYGQGSSQFGRWRLPADEFKSFTLLIAIYDRSRNLQLLYNTIFFSITYFILKIF